MARRQKHITALLIGAGVLGLMWWQSRKPAAATAGLGGLYLKRPIGNRLASRLGTVTDTRSLGGLGDTPEVRNAISAATLNDEGLIGQTTMAALVSGKNDPQTRLLAGTIPNNPGRNTTAVPWWAEGSILNDATPIDPYNLQPVDECGNAVNPDLKSPGNNGMADIVSVVNGHGHGMVDCVAEEVPYLEPGDADYGDMTETDYGEEDIRTYDPAPGTLLGLRSN